MRLFGEKGISLVEVLLVVIILGLMVFLLSSFPNAVNLIGRSGHLSLAREIASKQIEDKRSESYQNLASGSTTLSDPRISLLPQGGGTVLIEDCPSTICTQSENVKQMTVTVNWKENNKSESVSLKTLIAEGGLNQ